MTLALSRFFEPFSLRLRARDNRRSFESSFRSGFGPSNVSPFESVARRFTPRSTPTPAWLSQGAGASSSST